MNIDKRWRMVIAALFLPIAIPFSAGAYWLWKSHWLVWWLLTSAFLASTAWAASRLSKRMRPEPEWLDISQNITWTPQSKQAWARVEAVSLIERNADHDLSDSRFYLQTLTKVMNDVAEVYYPGQKQAILEIKIPYLLKVIEVLAKELRINFTENVPGSHIFSINDLSKGHRIASKGRELYRMFRILTAGIDPISAVIRELNAFANSNLISESADDIKRWLIDAYVKKIGYYAIELYSGHLNLDDEAFSRPTRQTRHEIDKLARKEKSVNGEPYRMLVMGQANAGKASLVNALADRRLAVVDAASSRLDRQTYFLQRDIFPSTLIVSCQRYHELQSVKERKSLIKKVERSDQVIVMISAINPAFKIDKAILDNIKQMSNAPRIIVALTQIDKLRPLREWNPPYDLTTPCSPKAETIRHFMINLAQQLAIDVEQIVPLCLRPGQIYNCEERLIPEILQQFNQEAEERRYNRCLRNYRRNAAKRKLIRQMYNAGYFMSKMGLQRLNKRQTATDQDKKNSGTG
ncbi:GTPase family protein [Methylomonas sp. MgM2]